MSWPSSSHAIPSVIAARSRHSSWIDYQKILEGDDFEGADWIKTMVDKEKREVSFSFSSLSDFTTTDSRFDDSRPQVHVASREATSSNYVAPAEDDGLSFSSLSVSFQDELNLRQELHPSPPPGVINPESPFHLRGLPFPVILHHLLSDNFTSSIISWHPDGLSFVIHNANLLEKQILRKYFGKESQFSSFRRKLKRYGFLTSPVRDAHARGWSFVCSHVMFIQNDRPLSYSIRPILKMKKKARQGFVSKAT